MCLQCLPFFSKSYDSPPSSPKPSPAQDPPSLEQPLLSPSTSPSYDTAPSVPESFSTPQTTFPLDSVSTSLESFQTPQTVANTETVPMEPFFTPMAAASPDEGGESNTESTGKSTSVNESDSTIPDVTSLKLPPLQDFEFPAAAQKSPLTPAPIGDSALSDNSVPTGDLPLPDVPILISQSAPDLDVTQTDENDSQIVPFDVTDTASFDSSQSDSALEEYNPPGFSDALLGVEGNHHGHRRHFRKHLKEFQQHLKEGTHLLKEGGQLLKDEGTRHFQNFMSNRKN